MVWRGFRGGLVAALVLTAGSAPAAGHLYVVGGEASYRADGNTPASERARMELEGATFASVRQAFESGRAPTVADLRVGRTWMCFAFGSELRDSTILWGSKHNSNPPYNYGPQGESIRFTATPERNFPGVVRRFVDDRSSELLALSSGQGVFFASTSAGAPPPPPDRNRDNNTWEARAWIGIRAEAHGRGIVFRFWGESTRSHVYGYYTESSQHETKDGYAICPWTVRP